MADVVLRPAGRWKGSLGYLAYGLGMLALALWLLFPEDALRRAFVGRLNAACPELRWRVRSVRMEAPLTLTAEAVEGIGPAETVLVRVDALTVQPEWAASLQRLRPRFRGRMQLGQGSLAGTVQFNGGSAEPSWEGTARQLQLADCPYLARRLGRDLAGAVSATFSGSGIPGQQANAQLLAEVRVENGRLELKKPILSHFAIPFSLVRFNLRGNGKRVQIEQGVGESELLACRFSGQAEWADDPVAAQIALRGEAHPTPRFFKGLSNTVAVQSLRAQLRDKPLPFRISGDPLNPSIHFEEFSLLFQTLEKELR
jgi:type II secretion system protein N